MGSENKVFYIILLVCLILLIFYAAKKSQAEIALERVKKKKGLIKDSTERLNTLEGKEDKAGHVFKFDDSFKYCNSELISNFKNQFNFIKSIRLKALKGEITNLELLESAIKRKFKSVLSEPDIRNEKAEEFRLIENKIGAYLMLTEENRNNIIGFDDIEQFHTIATKVFEILHNKDVRQNNKFLKNKDKLEVFSNFSDVQIRNTQVNVFIAAVWQLVNADGKIAEEESEMFEEFAKEISKKYIGDKDDRNDPMVANLMKDPDKMFAVIKSLPPEELNSFWETLFSFALVDNDFSVEEANLIGVIAGNVYEDLSDDEIRNWITDQIKKTK
tara:strand:+ start:2935 stop:3924 length:990 start_codon:yes stop_codon:yes gene_type:complete